jgi:hypothetical protein
MPFVSFYKFLAKKTSTAAENKFHQLKLYIPDTIVYGDSSEPYWIFSNFEVTN